MSPDIAMCFNQDCTIKKTCYRYMAIPSFPQSYMDFKQNTDGTCDNFWETKGRRIKKEA